MSHRQLTFLTAIAWLVCAESSVAAGQSIASSLSSLRSSDFAKRIQGFNALATLTAKQHLAMCSPAASQEIRRGLIAGLAVENAVVHGTIRLSEDEGDEYYGNLIGCVAALRDSTAIDVLLPAAGTGGGATDGLIALGDVAVPGLLRLVDSTGDTKVAALFTLGKMAQGEGPKPISVANRAAIRARSLAALGDKNRLVREQATIALRAFSDPEVRSAMMTLAATDPAKTSPSPGRTAYPVRVAARDWLRQDSAKVRKTQP